MLNKDPVYTVPDFKTSVALKFVIILQNLIKTNHRKSGKSKYDHKLTELNVVTTQIWYCVNGVKDYNQYYSTNNTPGLLMQLTYCSTLL